MRSILELEARNCHDVTHKHLPRLWAFWKHPVFMALAVACKSLNHQGLGSCVWITSDDHVHQFGKLSFFTSGEYDNMWDQEKCWERISPTAVLCLPSERIPARSFLCASAWAGAEKGTWPEMEKEPLLETCFSWILLHSELHTAASHITEGQRTNSRLWNMALNHASTHGPGSPQTQRA